MMGLYPAIAIPAATPAMLASASGALNTRPGNAPDNPRVTPKTPPLGSAMSSPHMTILDSRSISSRKP